MKVKSYYVVILLFCFFLNSCKLNKLHSELSNGELSLVGLSFQAQIRNIAKNNFVLEGFYGDGCKKSARGQVWKLFGGNQIHEHSLSLNSGDTNCNIFLTKLYVILNNVNNEYNIINNGENKYLLTEYYSNKFLEIKKLRNSQGNLDDKIYIRVKIKKGDLFLPPTIHLQLGRMKEFDYSIQGKNIKIDYSIKYPIKELAHEAIYRVYPFENGVYAVGYKTTYDYQTKSQGGLFYTNDFLISDFKKVESIKSYDVRYMVFDSEFIYAASYRDEGGGGGLYYASYDDNLNFKMVQDPLILNKKITRVAVSGKNIYVVTNENSFYFTTEGVNGVFREIVIPNIHINSLHISENNVIITTEKNVYYTNDLTSGKFYKNNYELQDNYVSEIAVAKNIIILGGKNGIYISKEGLEGEFIPQQELQGSEIYNLFLQGNYIYASILCKNCGYNLRNNLISEKNKNIVHSDGIYQADINESPIVFRNTAHLSLPMSFSMFKDKALVSNPSGLFYYEDSN